MSDNPNIPQLNETLVLAGYFPNGKSFSYSWGLMNEHKTIPDTGLPYAEARERLLDTYQKELQGNQDAEA